MVDLKSLSEQFAVKSRIGQYGDKLMEGDYHVGQILDALPLALTNVCFEGKNGHDAGVTPALPTQRLYEIDLAAQHCFLVRYLINPKQMEGRRDASACVRYLCVLNGPNDESAGLFCSAGNRK
jgi:hypothetical protein